MTSLTEYQLVPAEPGSRSAVLALLRANELPIVDLDESKALFACLNNKEVIGTGGLEFFGDTALLRSISVKKELQKKGIGKFIVLELEKIAKQKGISDLYLLTTTAEDFFIRLSYRKIDRENAPMEIKATTEYSFACPSSARVLRKHL